MGEGQSSDLAGPWGQNQVLPLGGGCGLKVCARPTPHLLTSNPKPQGGAVRRWGLWDGIKS